jgi:hypothetical protein
VQQMQQIAYVASPYLIFGYPQFLQAYDNAKWEGYVKVPGGFPDYNGDALSYDSYIGLHLATAGAPAATSGLSTWVYIVVVVVAVAIVAGVVVMRRGRRGPQIEAAD